MSGGDVSGGDAATLILAKVSDVQIKLAVVDSKLDTLTGSTSDHESRLRALESFRWKLTGVAITAGLLSGAVATLIAWALTHR